MSRSETCFLTQEELEVQIEKRRIVMEKRQVNEEERRQFLPEMDLEPVAWVALLFFLLVLVSVVLCFLVSSAGYGQSKIESFGWKMMKVDAPNIQIPLFEEVLD